MIIQNATYIYNLPRVGEDIGDKIAIMVTLDNGEISVPLDPSNRHYAEIMRQVEAGDLTIEEAE